MNKQKIIKAMRNNFILRLIIPYILRLFNSDYTYCNRCGLPWNWCDIKDVKYDTHTSMFATCEYCWNRSTLEQLKQYYSKVYNESYYSYDTSLEHILQCVENEYKKTHNNT